MIYFLTSNPLDIANQKLNSDNMFIENLKKNLPDKLNLLYISSNPNQYKNTDKYGNEIKIFFSNSGFEIDDFRILDGRNRQNVERLVMDSNCIVLAGGYVPTQNHFFDTIHLAELFQKYNNKVIIGISAGSMNCALKVYSPPVLKNETNSSKYKKFLKGLGITETSILPHYQVFKNRILDSKQLFEDIILPDSMEKEIYGLNDGSYICGNGREETIWGEYFLIKDGKVIENIKKL